MAAALGGLAIALSIIFGALVLVLVAEIYYVFYWKRHRVWNRRRRIINVDAERGLDISRETGLVGYSASVAADPELVTKLCSGVMGSNSSLYMQGVLGGPRLLFTIKEETMEDMEHEEDSCNNTLQSKLEEKHQRKYAYSIGLIPRQETSSYCYKSLRAISPSLQPIATYSELPKSVFFNSSASDSSSSPASSYSFGMPSSPPPRYHRSSLLSSPSWRSSCSSSPSLSKRRFESPSLSSLYGQQDFYISNPIYEGDNLSPFKARFSSQGTTPFCTPLSSPSLLLRPSDTPPLTPPLTPIRAPLAAFSVPLLNGPSLLRNLSGSTNSFPTSLSPSPSP